MSDEPAILINLLRVAPEKQGELLALLRQNIETVVRTLAGLKTTKLIASQDGASVCIYSEWESSEAIAAMRSDARMTAYFPKIAELASMDSILGLEVMRETRAR